MHRIGDWYQSGYIQAWGIEGKRGIRKVSRQKALYSQKPYVLLWNNDGSGNQRWIEYK